MNSPEPEEVDHSQVPWGPPLTPEEDARQLEQIRSAMRQYDLDRQAEADTREADNRRIELEADRNEAEAEAEYDSLGFASALDEYGSIGFETACMTADANPSQADYNATSPEALAAMGPESVMDRTTAAYPDAWCGPDCRYDAAAEAEAGS